MSDKSHVTMEQHVCLVCGQPFDTGNLLLDTHIVNGALRKTFEMRTTTGWGLCPPHEKLHKDGFVALVACDESKSRDERGRITPSSAWRSTSSKRRLRTSKARNTRCCSAQRPSSTSCNP